VRNIPEPVSDPYFAPRTALAPPHPANKPILGVRRREAKPALLGRGSARGRAYAPGRCVRIPRAPGQGLNIAPEAMGFLFFGALDTCGPSRPVCATEGSNAPRGRSDPEPRLAARDSRPQSERGVAIGALAAP
jgi:hypothetical protein